MITKFDGKHAFLSNFFPAEVEWEGHKFPTVEHAYQAAKTDNMVDKMAIQQAKTPGQAKRLGRAVVLREGWDFDKVCVMKLLLRQKFANPELRALLLETSGEDLIEGNTWGDKFWGCVLENNLWVGENVLGRLLMQRREQIEQWTQMI
jgi:N-glycosidase YbiA